jgi:hypothetical protein
LENPNTIPSASRTVVNGEMSFRRLKLSIYEVVTPEEEEEEEEEEIPFLAFYIFKIL